jgi:hypothetical protein
MRRRLEHIGLLALLGLTAAGCADELPTLADEAFPPGSVPVTREVILPASAFFRFLGSHTGYGRTGGSGFLVLANDYEGLRANVLADFGPFPREVSYTRNGSERRDSLFEYGGGRLVLRVDTVASTGGPVTFRLWAATQPWSAASATWTAAMDTGGAPVSWTQPGGTRGELLAEREVTLSPTGTDSVVLQLSPEQVVRLADTASHGVVLTLDRADRRIELTSLVLRASVRPDSAAPDTTINVNVPLAASTTVFTPDPPDAPPGVLAVGGVRRARALIEIDPRQTVPGVCPGPGACAPLALRDVRINHVTVLFTPLDVPNGFDPLGPVPLGLRILQEPELGRFAPLGAQVLDRPTTFSVRDSLLELPITGLTTTFAVNDTLPTTFALVSESPLTMDAPTFGLAFFRSDPLLRIIYTVPSRRQLP